jgi:cytochrome c biogenesis protein CcmG/thiol:disulfide interchange protein DsbE
VIGAITALLALLAYGLTKETADTTIDQRLADGRPASAPGFALPLLERGAPPAALAERLDPALRDGRLGLAELRGMPVVLSFWASWCPPCRDEVPRLEQLWRSARRRGVLFLGLNMQDISGDARQFLREFDVSYPSVRDRGNDVGLDWGVVAMPETFFITREGEVVSHTIGAISVAQLKRGVQAAESGRVAPATSGGERRPTR